MAQAGALRRRVLFCGVAGPWAPLGGRRTRQAPVAAQSLVRGQFFGLVFQALPSQTLVHPPSLVPCLTSLASVLSHSAVSRLCTFAQAVCSLRIDLWINSMLAE